MKLLVTGATGQVGREICALADRLGIECQGLSSAQLDLTRETKVWRALRRAKPTYVINAAAYTAVDAAEDNREECLGVNRDAVSYLGKSCKRLGVPVLHLSTDYIFGGDQVSPYTETDEPRPLNVYGDSKLQGEQALASVLDEHIILRVSWVFSEWRSNFVKTMVRLCQERETLQVVDDQRGCPTPATDIARVLIAMVQQLDCGANDWGTYHYCGREATSWYQLCQDIVAETRNYGTLATEAVIPIKTHEYPYRAQRPLNSVLSCHRILENFGIQQRSWKPELARVVQRCCEWDEDAVRAL